jgi:hypothetical protein
MEVTTAETGAVATTAHPFNDDGAAMFFQLEEPAEATCTGTMGGLTTGLAGSAEAVPETASAANAQSPAISPRIAVSLVRLADGGENGGFGRRPRLYFGPSL